MGVIYTKIVDVEIERESDRLYIQAEIDIPFEYPTHRNIDVSIGGMSWKYKHIRK
jgi:hypothetical protein